MKQKTTISIKDIAIDCILGVSEKERSRKQTIFISIDLVIDATKASKTDNIHDTVNYRNVYEGVIMLVRRSQYHLLERLASEIISYCLDFEGVLSATVKVHKSNILEKAKGVSVEISSE